MPAAYPPEFRRDVVTVARKGVAPISQIAKGFGIFEWGVHRWQILADIQDGVRPGATDAESVRCRFVNQRTLLGSGGRALWGSPKAAMTALRHGS